MNELKVKSITERADGMMVYELKDDEGTYVYNADKFASLDDVKAEISKHKAESAERVKAKKAKKDKIKLEFENAGY